MEILDMSFAGVGTLLIMVGLAYAVSAAWKEWQQDRKDWKEIDEAEKRFREEHEWKPRMIDGVDCGKWVIKDVSRPVGP